MLPTSAGVEPATSWSPVGRRIQLSHQGRHLAFVNLAKHSPKYGFIPNIKGLGLIVSDGDLNFAYRSLWKTFDISIKSQGQPKLIIFFKIYWPYVPNAEHLAPDSLALSFRRRILKIFYHWAWRPSWTYDLDAVNIPPPPPPPPKPIEAPCEIWLSFAQWFLRRRRWNHFPCTKSTKNKLSADNIAHLELGWYWSVSVFLRASLIWVCTVCLGLSQYLE